VESNELRLDGAWAVVTGASKGIGLGIADRFVAAGANVLLVARGADDLARAARALAEGASPGQEVRTAVADASQPEALEELFDRIDDEIPDLNVYVANVGSGSVVPFLDVTRDEWDRIIALNLTGTFIGCQRAARHMVRGDAADRSILVVSSIRAIGARPGRLPYSVTKAGLNQFVRVAAYELAPHGIRVNALSPGITATPMALERNPEIFAQMTAEVPLGRAGTPSDMGSAAVYLSSPAARFVTGANLVVDGGESLY
jgi:NAD(P)-dependent dehydrogenase (short-subunit alcohol dehydrogenase family)